MKMDFEQDLEGLTWTGKENIGVRIPSTQIYFSDIPHSFDSVEDQSQFGQKMLSAPEMYDYMRRIAIRMDADALSRKLSDTFREMLTFGKNSHFSKYSIHTNTIIKCLDDGSALMKHGYLPEKSLILTTWITCNPLNSVDLNHANKEQRAFIQDILGTNDSAKDIESVLKKITKNDKIRFYTQTDFCATENCRQVSFSRVGNTLYVGTAWPMKKGYIPWRVI